MTTKEFVKAQWKKKSGKSTKYLSHAAPEMAEGMEIKQMINEFKDTLTTEIKDFLSEFNAYHMEMERDFKKITEQITELQQKLERTDNRVNDIEHRVAEIQDEQISQQKRNEDMMFRMKEIETQMDYLESKSRQNNIRIYNVPEKIRGQQHDRFSQ